jgi:hypothetical protein
MVLIFSFDTMPRPKGSKNKSEQSRKTVPVAFRTSPELAELAKKKAQSRPSLTVFFEELIQKA